MHDVGDDDVWRDRYRRIAGRCIDERSADAYVQNTIDQPRGLFRMQLGDAKVSTWRMPVSGEDAMVIWHDRYYTPGTDF